MTTQPSALIVHADDFGLTVGVNAGILLAHVTGIVRSASLMVTTPGFEQAVALARRHPSLDLGLHLNLTTGRPCLPPSAVPSLVDRAGYFHRLDAWLLRALRRRIDPAEVHAELAAQMEHGLATGLPFSHVDGHHHIHLFAPATAAVRFLVLQHGFRAVRLSDERPLLRTSPTVARLLRVAPLTGAWRRQWLLSLASRRAARLLRAFAHADYFAGLPLIGNGLDAGNLSRLLTMLPPGITELMCHPGYGDDTLVRLDPGVAAREREIALLTNPALRDTLRSARIDLLRIADLPGLRNTPANSSVSMTAPNRTRLT